MTDTWAGIAEDPLRLLVAEGLTAGQIAKAMATTRAAVIGKCHRLSLTLKRSPGPRKRKHVGRPVGAVSSACWQEPSPPRRFTWQDPTP